MYGRTDSHIGSCTGSGGMVGRKERGGIYRKGKGISLNCGVRAIIDLRWYVVNTTGDVRPCFPSSLILYPCILSPVFPRKFLLHSSFAFATDVPFTDLFLIYNIYWPVVSFRSLFSYIPPRCSDSWSSLDLLPFLFSRVCPVSCCLLVSTVASALTFVLSSACPFLSFLLF